MSPSGTKKSKKPSQSENVPVAPDSKVSSASAECPKIKYKMVDFTEVVKQAAEKWVKGPANDPQQKTIFDGDPVTREEKDGKYRQYINLDPVKEGNDKRHPEYGREITFRARIERVDGETEDLSGIKVVFSSECTRADNRQNAVDEIWADKNLKAGQQGGFTPTTDDKDKIIATTNDKGWTSVVKFQTSQYGGDTYAFAANMEDTVEGYAEADKKESKTYVVWRKFWYQMTYANGYNAPKPEKAEQAYAEVFAEMIKANEKKFSETGYFTSADFGNDEDKMKKFISRTFYEECQLKAKGSSTKVANVGVGNIKEFKDCNKLKLKTDDKEPVKGNLIVCEYQCDPSGETGEAVYALTDKDKPLITIGSGKSPDLIVSNPPLRMNDNLVVTGEWSLADDPNWAKGGDITDECIVILQGNDRPTTQTVKIDLTKATGNPPDPSGASPVFIKLKVQGGEGFLGWATSAGIVAVYRPTAADGESGSEVDYNDTAAHEFGHKFTQTPEPADVTNSLKSLKNHSFQYVEHGGSGSHCRHGVTKYRRGNKWDWTEAQLTFDTTIKNDPTTDKDFHKVADSTNFEKLIGKNIKVDGTNHKLKSVQNNSLYFQDSFTVLRNKIIEFTIKTKIKTASNVAVARHEVVSTSDFYKIKGLNVKVNGVDKKLINVNPGSNSLEFDSGFTAAKDDVVEFKLSTTTIRNPSERHYIHEIDDPTHFEHLRRGSEVKVNGVSRTLGGNINGSKLTFTEWFKVDKGATVETTVNWQDDTEKEPVPLAGDCIMFHMGSDKCSHKFCDTCKPYLQLEKMDNL